VGERQVGERGAVVDYVITSAFAGILEGNGRVLLIVPGVA